MDAWIFEIIIFGILIISRTSHGQNPSHHQSPDTTTLCATVSCVPLTWEKEGGNEELPHA